MSSSQNRFPAARGVTRRIACAVAALLLAAGPALADDYPSRSVRVIVGSNAGGGGDTVARLVAPHLSQILGQPVVVENKPGAGGNLAADLVAKAPADGYTLLLAFTGHVINPGLYTHLPFDAEKDFAPVTMLATNETVLMVKPSLAVNSVKELIAAAKAAPGKLTMGAQTGSSQFLAGELFKSMAHVDILTVPYKGNAGSMMAMLTGEIDVMFNTVATALPQIRAGKVRALAVTGETRSNVLPDLPTVSEAGLPGFSSVGWYGILAPARTPAAVVQKLNAALTQIVNMPEVRERLTAQGNVAVGVGPQEFDAFIKKEIPRWTQVIRDAHIKLD